MSHFRIEFHREAATRDPRDHIDLVDQVSLLPLDGKQISMEFFEDTLGQRRSPGASPGERKDEESGWVVVLPTTN